MPLKEATIKAASRQRGILNAAFSAVKEAPLPVKLVIGGTIGTAAITVLSGCLTQNQPCEISPENLNPNSAARPITIVSCNPKKEVSTADQAQLKKNYGADLKGLYLWAAVNKGSGTENTGDGTIAFSTYSFENGRSMVVFPSGKEDYNSGENKKYEYSASWFETADGKILYSYHYKDELNPGKAISFFTIEYNKPEGVSLTDLAADGADPSKILGNPTNITISNPPANEIITYNVDSKNPDDIKLIEQIANLFNPGPSVAHALGESTATKLAPTKTPTEAPTITPTPVLIEVAPGVTLPEDRINGYVAKDTNGKILYVKDIFGKWIPAMRDVVVVPVTPEDWTNVNTRLGSDFAINIDGAIPGVKDLAINKENGEVTINVDGNGQETFHISNIKTQEIDGVKRLLVAGYAWNGETKLWEVFNPEFPMNSPKDELPWFNRGDIVNGNWLRWHQRILQINAKNEGFVKSDGSGDVEKYMKHLFEGTLPSGYTWGASETKGTKPDVPGSVIDYIKLDWQNNNIDAVDRKKNGIPKAEYPGRSGLSFAYITDAKSISISFDALNGPSMSMIMDDVMWAKEHRNTAFFTRLALGSGHEPDSSMVKDTAFHNVNDTESWLIWPIIKVNPSETISSSYGLSDIEILKEPLGITLREAAVNYDHIDPSGSLVEWGGGVYINPGN